MCLRGCQYFSRIMLNNNNVTASRRTGTNLLHKQRSYFPLHTCWGYSSSNLNAVGKVDFDKLQSCSGFVFLQISYESTFLKAVATNMVRLCPQGYISEKSNSVLFRFFSRQVPPHILSCRRCVKKKHLFGWFQSFQLLLGP